MNDETDFGVFEFLMDCVAPRDGSSLTISDLYERYCEWCDVIENNPLALPNFGRELDARGIYKTPLDGRVRYLDIALREDWKARATGNVRIEDVAVCPWAATMAARAIDLNRADGETDTAFIARIVMAYIDACAKLDSVPETTQ